MFCILCEKIDNFYVHSKKIYPNPINFNDLKNNL